MKRSSRRRITSGPLFAAAIVAGLSGALLAASPQPKREVPSVLGLSAKDAKAAIEEVGLIGEFRIGIDPVAEAGRLRTYWQQPGPGAVLERGAKVRVLLYSQEMDSTKAEVGVAPPVLGLPGNEAKALAESAGYKVTFRLGPAPPTPQQEFVVTAQNPRPRSRRPGGSEILLTIYARSRAGDLPQQGDWLTQVVATPFLNLEEQQVEPRHGMLVIGAVDLTAPAGAERLEVRRFLRSEVGDAGLLGTRWRLNWEKRLLRNRHLAVVFEGIAGTFFHATAENHRFQTADGDRIEITDDVAVRTRTDGVREFYDEQGRLTRVDRLNGNEFVLTYAANGRLSRVAGPLGSWLQFVTDSQGRLIRAESSSGAVARYYYGDDRPDADHVDPGGTLRYRYDGSGQLSLSEHPLTGSNRYIYDFAGRVRTRRSADGTAEFFYYNELTGKGQRIDAMGRTTNYYHGPDNRYAEVLTPLGRRTIVENDEAERPRSITGPTGETTHIEYDDLGRVSRVERPAAGVTRFEYQADIREPAAQIYSDGLRREFRYDAQRNLVTVTGTASFPDNAEFEYFANGLPKSVNLPGSGKTHFTYDDRGQLETVTDAAGGTTQYQFDAHANLLKLIDPLGRVTSWERDRHGRVTAVTEPNGSTTRFQYSPTGHLIRRTGPDGAVTKYEYDSRGQTIEKTDPLGGVTRYGYHADGKLAEITDPGGHVERFEYDSAGNLLRHINPLGGVTTTVYGPSGKPLKLTRPDGTVTRYEFSPAGQFLGVTKPDGVSVRYRYDRGGQVTGVVDAAGRESRIVRTPAGQIAEVAPPQGPGLRFRYDEAGRVAAISRGDHTLVEHEYDALDRRSKSRYSAGREVDYRYDAVGDLLGWKDNLGSGETFKYDDNRRRVAHTNSYGAVTRYRYDDADRLREVVNPNGAKWQFEYDAAGNLRRSTTPMGGQARSEYDAAGRLTLVEQPDGGETRYAYDGLGNVTGTTDPLGNETRTKYSAAGRALQITDARGQKRSYSYDSAGRVVEKRLSDGTIVRYGYDDRGNLVEVDDGKFPVRYTFDVDGNRTAIEYPAIHRKLHYEYDELGRRATFTDSEGRKRTYEYDEYDRLSTIRLGSDKGLFRLKYDAADRLVSLTYPNGITGRWKYDGEGRTERLAYSDGDGKTLAGWSYRYDAAGNLSEVVDADGQTTRYRYDLAGQLIEEKPAGAPPVSYAYSPGGNRSRRESGDESVKYRYDQADRLLQAGDVSYEYDAAGNCIEKRDSQGITRYSYDAEGRLIEVTLPDNSKVRYGYAPTGERIWREDANGRTYFVTDGVEVIAELNEELQPVAGYVHGPGIDRPLAVTRGEESHFLHADRLGSIRNITTGTGTSVTRYRYDAFGRTVEKQGDVDSSYTFAARRYDADTGLYFNRARYYDSTNGRFISPDIVRGSTDQPLSLNRYAYVLNAPTRFSDPTGKNEDDFVEQARATGLLDEVQELATEGAGTIYKGSGVGETVGAGRAAKDIAQLSRTREGITRQGMEELVEKRKGVLESLREPDAPTRPNIVPETPAAPRGGIVAENANWGKITTDIGEEVLEKPGFVKRVLGSLGGLVKRIGKRFVKVAPFIGPVVAAGSVARAEAHEREHVAARESGAEIGGTLGEVLGPALILIVVPEPSSSMLGAALIGGALIGSLVGDETGGALVPPGKEPVEVVQADDDDRGDVASNDYIEAIRKRADQLADTMRRDIARRVDRDLTTQEQERIRQQAVQAAILEDRWRRAQQQAISARDNTGRYADPYAGYDPFGGQLFGDDFMGDSLRGAYEGAGFGLGLGFW